MLARFECYATEIAELSVAIERSSVLDRHGDLPLRSSADRDGLHRARTDSWAVFGREGFDFSLRPDNIA